MQEDTTAAPNQRKTRIGIVVVVALFVIGSSVIGFWGMKIKGQNPTAAPGMDSRFGLFAEQRDIGTVAKLDTGVGIDETGVILTVNHPPANQPELKQFAMDMFTKFRELDGGEDLTIVYQDGNGKHKPLAVCRYSNGSVTIDLFQDGQTSEFKVSM